MISAAVDMMSLLLIVLPLYPKTIDGYVYAVNLLVYGETTTRSLFPYWALFVALMVVGMIRLILIKVEAAQYVQHVAALSMMLSVVMVIFLALSREAYAATLAFLMLVIKGMLILRSYGIMNPSRQ